MTEDQLIDFILENHENRERCIETIKGYGLRAAIQTASNANRINCGSQNQGKEFIDLQNDYGMVKAEREESEKLITGNERIIIIKSEGTNEC